MILRKENILIYNIFIFGLLASLVGTISISGVNLHFFFVVLSFCLALILFFDFSKLRLNFYIISMIALIFISSLQLNGKFGFLQILYTLSPLLFFLLGFSNKFSENFFESFINIMEKTVIILFFLYLAHIFLFHTDLDTRWSSIFISLVCLIVFSLSKKNKIKILSAFLVFFVLVSGSRGAIVSLFLSYFISYFFINFRLRYSIPITLLLGFIISIFYKGILSLLFKIDFLRERTFFDGNYDFEKIKNVEFNTSGRDIAWPIYWNHIETR